MSNIVIWCVPMSLCAVNPAIRSWRVQDNRTARLFSQLSQWTETRHGVCFVFCVLLKECLHACRVHVLAASNVSKRRRSPNDLVCLPTQLDQLVSLHGLHSQRMAADLEWKRVSASRTRSYIIRTIRWPSLLHACRHSHARTCSFFCIDVCSYIS